MLKIKINCVKDNSLQWKLVDVNLKFICVDLCRESKYSAKSCISEY